MRTTVICTALIATALSAAAQPTSEVQVIRPGTNRVIVEPDYPRGGLDADIWTDDDVYHIGDLLNVHFRVSRDAHVYIFNTDAAGVTRQIFPNPYDQDNYMQAGRTHTLPRWRHSNYNFRVAGPAGTETLEIYAVADNSFFREQFRTYSESNPYPQISARQRDMLSRIEVEVEVESPRRGQVIVEPGHGPDHARAFTQFQVINPYRRPPAVGGALDIDVRPNHARVILDGQHMGYGSMTITNLEPGWHDLQVSHPGHETVYERVRIRPGRTTELSVRLDRRWRYEQWDNRWDNRHGHSDDDDSWYVRVSAVFTDD